MRRSSVAFACLVFSGLGLAQDIDYYHHNVVFAVGPAFPVGTTTNVLTTAPLIHIGYGYRFNRLFQADAGFQMAFGAANNRNPEITSVGTIKGGDQEYMIPFGGRVYVAQPFKRLDVSTGGGATYLHYSETVSSGNPDYSIGCYSCTSRDGFGGYGLGNVSYFLDSNRSFHVGTTVYFIAASTNGAAVGNVPPLKTTDHWTNLLFEFGFSF